MRVPIEEFSSKVRQGPAVDDEADYSFPVWAGVLPLNSVPGEPISDARLDAAIELPEYVSQYSRKASGE